MVQKALENGYYLRFQGAKCSVVNVFEGRNFETFLCLSGFWAINVKFGYAFGLIKAQTDYYLNRLDILWVWLL